MKKTDLRWCEWVSIIAAAISIISLIISLKA